jgi:small subunit ribosomal protein S4e
MHLKRIPAPKNWIINRKERKFITRPMPGPHRLKESIPISILLKEFLNQAKIKKEVKYILNNNKLLIDKIPRKDIRFPIGVMDIVEIPDLKEKYVVLYNEKGKFMLNPIKDASQKLLKIIGKTVVKFGKMQLNLDDGRNMIIPKSAYSVGDTIVFDLDNKKIKSHLKMEKDALLYFTGGSYKGKIGKMQKIEEKEGSEEQRITFSIGKENFVTLKKYAFVIGKDKPVLEIKHE